MKKRLLSLLVALCMAVTLLPVSALTAWAEGGDQLRIVDGYPVGSGGEGWSYDGTTLDLHPASSTEYDFLSIISGNGNVTKCKLTIGGNATIVRGNFDNTVINNGKISGGYFYSSSPLTNHGTIIDGLFVSAVSNESEGKIENGTFRSTVTNNGIIKGGIFSEQPAGGTVASGYTLNINFPENGSYEIIDAGISYFGNSGYVIPNSNHNTSISIYIFFRDSQAILFPIDVTFGDTHCLLEDWAPSARYYDNGSGYFSVTFTAPHADADTVTLSILTRLVIDKAGYPVGTEGGTQNYSGNGWKFENGTLTLESGDYDFSGEENALGPLNPNVQLEVKPGAKLTGGAFAKEPKGAGTFRTVTLNGTGSITAVNGLASGDWGNKLYAVKTGNNTITASEPIRDINRILLENDDPIYPPDSSNKKTVCINIQQFLNSVSALDPEANIILNQASHGLSLIMDSDGTPVIVNAPFKPDGNFYNYCGNGWHYQALSGDPGNVYLESGNYNFLYTDPVNKKGENLRSVNCGIVNEGSTIEDGIFNALVANGQPGSTSSEPHEIEGGTFAAGLLYNDGVITGGAFNGKRTAFSPRKPC